MITTLINRTRFVKWYESLSFNKNNHAGWTWMINYHSSKVFQVITFKHIKTGYNTNVWLSKEYYGDPIPLEVIHQYCVDLDVKRKRWLRT